MEIFIHPNGPFSVNTYCITENNLSLIIDPGSASHPVINFLQMEKILPVGILITHPHIDHVEGIPSFQSTYADIRTYLSVDGKETLRDVPGQARMFGLPIPNDIVISDFLPGEGEIEMGPFSIQYLSTPGHCDGSLTFRIRGALFSGDALFRGTIGRTDLPGGNHNLLVDSIKMKIMTFDDDTPIYPGHGEKTTVGYERKRNPFLQGFSLNSSDF